MGLFQFAVIQHPTEEGKKHGETSKMIVGITSVLAKDEDAAIIEAGRKIPQEVWDTARDRIQVAVRRF